MDKLIKREEDRKKILQGLKENMVRLYSEDGVLVIFIKMKGFLIDKKI